MSDCVDPPIGGFACDLNALTPNERNRRKELARSVGSAVSQRIELDNGFALQLDSARTNLVAIAEWIALERRCCPFLDFRLEAKSDGGISVALTGKAGVKDFLLA